MRWASTDLTGWGRSSVAQVEAARPERLADAIAAFGEAGEGGILARGAGRSYGDVALNDGGRVLLTGRLDRFLAFDPERAELVVEPGVTFGDLMGALLTQGYLSPVSPGTAFTTVGGALANDVHGKNHDVAGSFGDHVQWIDLLLPSGEIRRVDPAGEPALFQATVGGIGLTGVILAVCFRLLQVPSNAVQRREQRISDLDGFLAALAAVPDDQMVYSVGWIDGLARGPELGRGILEIATPASEAVAAKPRRRRGVPVNFPGFALNSWSVGAFNELYFRRVPVGGRERHVPYEQFFYPLDALLQWNRIYGKRGFFQFQCVVPREDGELALRDLLESTARARAASPRAGLKTLGGPGQGCLSFPIKGYTLAFDFPRKPGINQLLRQLERITRQYGGRVYLAKDANLSAESFRTMYPRVEEFEATLEQIDPDHRMTSDLARRLGLREPAP